MSRRWDWEDLLLSSLLLLLVLILVGLISLMATVVPVYARAEAACLAAGYPRSSVDWALRGYCIKRVDYTDVVVALSDLREKVGE